MQKKKIVLVTSSQPSLNPRMIKEADTLVDCGYEVIVIGQYWNDWATETDKILLASKKWKFVRVGGSPKINKYTYIASRVFHKLARKMLERAGPNLKFAELSMGRCSYLLYREAVKQKADLYIGHNPGGLAPAILAAKKNNAKCGFDAEDFHRLEYSDDLNHPDVKCKTFLEEKYFPKADYIITSSPNISSEYQKIFPELNFNTILNVFPKVKNIEVKLSRPEEPLKLFWFSQTIGPNRGLDEAIEAIRIIGNPLIELHALGYPREHAISHYKGLAEKYNFRTTQLWFYDPIPPDDIYKFATQFDIGLATEIGIPFNRKICLTNKIFTYIQSGLALAASKTAAQQDLLDMYPNCGKIFEMKDAKGLASILEFYFNDRKALNKAKKSSYLYGQNVLNWETESIKFIKLIEQTIA